MDTKEEKGLQSLKNIDMDWRMKPNHDSFVLHKVRQMTPLSELPAKVVAMLSKIGQDAPYQEPTAIVLVPKRRENVLCTQHSGHYFMGGLPALMQAVRLLQNNPTATVSYVNDGMLKKSTQSAHQGHVHPTEWTTPELGTKQLIKVLLKSLRLLHETPPDDVLNYSYVHFPLSKISLPLFMRNIAFRLVHTLLSKNGVSEDDRWQCEAVRSSLAFHKALSDEIEAAGEEPTYASNGRLIWWQELEGIERKRALWNELGIQTATLSQEELRNSTLLKDDIQLYGLKVPRDGKFFPNIDRKICAYLSKKYPNSFQARNALVSEIYIDEKTNEPFAILEILPDGPGQIVAVDSLYGSCGHNQVFKYNPKNATKKALWDEVPVSGVSTLWVSTIEKKVLLERMGVPDMSDTALISKLKMFVGTANLTNLHMTIWDACVDGDSVHILVRATQGANFNSEFADPKDLYNMTANIKRFFIGSWKLITAGSCTRKTTTSNVPELTENFIHGLSGIGFSFSAAPKELLYRSPLTANLVKKIFYRYIYGQKVS